MFALRIKIKQRAKSSCLFFVSTYVNKCNITEYVKYKELKKTYHASSNPRHAMKNAYDLLR